MLNLKKAEVTAKQRRMNHLYEASESIDEMRALIQLSRDLKAINLNGFSELSSLTREISNEIGGFIKYERTTSR